MDAEHTNLIHTHSGGMKIEVVRLSEKRKGNRGNER